MPSRVKCPGPRIKLHRWLTAKGEIPDGAIKGTLGLGCDECGVLWEAHDPDLATLIYWHIRAQSKRSDSVLNFVYGSDDRPLPQGPVDFLFLEQLRDRYEATSDPRELA